MPPRHSWHGGYFGRAGLAMPDGQWQKLCDNLNKGLEHSGSAMLKTTTAKFSGKG